MGQTHAKFRNVVRHVVILRPDLADLEATLAEGRVVVDGRIVTNPNALVRSDASVRILPARPLRGEDKLRVALDAFGVTVTGRVALDLGAAAGGFTTVLLERGARRVYAVDAGHGQLRGALRAHSRVVNLERTNLGALAPELVPCSVELVTIDLSYLSVADAVPQLEHLTFVDDADLISLVKPMFELRLAGLRHDDRTLRKALEHAIRGIERGRWNVQGRIASPIRGSRGAREWLVHARRRSASDR